MSIPTLKNRQGWHKLKYFIDEEIINCLKKRMKVYKLCHGLNPIKNNVAAEH